MPSTRAIITGHSASSSLLVSSVLLAVVGLFTGFGLPGNDGSVNRKVKLTALDVVEDGVMFAVVEAGLVVDVAMVTAGVRVEDTVVMILDDENVVFSVVIVEADVLVVADEAVAVVAAEEEVVASAIGGAWVVVAVEVVVVAVEVKVFAEVIGGVLLSLVVWGAVVAIVVEVDVVAVDGVVPVVVWGLSVSVVDGGALVDVDCGEVKVVVVAEVGVEEA